MINIDLPRARELLLQAVDTQGRDFVYNPDGQGDCLYQPARLNKLAGITESSPQMKTGCLIGVALKIAGVEMGLVHNGSISTEVGLLRSSGAVNIDAAATRYFGYAQAQQDNGTTWGTAYDVAESSLIREE
jgi:hypothetical protein